MSQITDFIGRFFSKTTAPDASMSEMGRDAGTGAVYLDTRTTQTGVTQGGSLMVYSNGAWYGVNLTTSSSTSTTTSSSTSTTTTTTTT